MKHLSRFSFLLALLVTLIWSCKKDENKIFFEGGTPPVLTASESGTIPLSFATSENEAVIFSWTNPDYKFTTGVSSQDVSYLLEIDKAGSNFASANKHTVAIKSDLNLKLTQGQLNDYLLNQMNLPVDAPADIEVRLKSNLGANASTLISNVLKFNVRPFSTPPKVNPPSADNLWMVGDAAPSGWTNPLLSPNDVSQKFTKISSTVYELTLNMPGGGGYKLIQDNGVWATQYHMLDGGTWEGGNFEMKDSDPQFPGPPSAGTYKITVDFQKGKFTAIKL
jgi:starch-binding outer membrane protein SusE/F